LAIISALRIIPTPSELTVFTVTPDENSTTFMTYTISNIFINTTHFCFNSIDMFFSRVLIVNIIRLNNPSDFLHAVRCNRFSSVLFNKFIDLYKIYRLNQ